MLYLVSYELYDPDRDYSGLFEELKAHGDWLQLMRSVWLVSTDEDAALIFNRLGPHVDKGDSLMVIKAGADYRGWLSEEAAAWLAGHTGA